MAITHKRRLGTALLITTASLGFVVGSIFFYRKNKELLSILWTQKAAEHNVIVEQVRLGVFYYNGQGVSKNPALAAFWFRRAQAGGDVDAAVYLAQIDLLGLGAPTNYAEALRLLTVPLVAARPQAQYLLGSMYLDGHGVPRNYARARELIEKAASSGMREAQFSMGAIYLQGVGVPSNPNIAAEWLEKCANQGLLVAQQSLANMYLSGLGVPVDKAKGLAWTKKAADEKNAGAETLLALSYDFGVVFPQDTEKAKKYYRDVLMNAQSGSADAEYSMAMLVSEGYGFLQDEREATQWAKKSAEQGNAAAQTMLGYRYWAGIGVTRDIPQAVQWLRKAADQDQANAQTTLAIFLLQGARMTTNSGEAVKWFAKIQTAAADGKSAALQMAALLDEQGIGRPLDIHKAVSEYHAAENLGEPDAALALGQLYFNGDEMPKDYDQAFSRFNRIKVFLNPEAIYYWALMKAHGWGTAQNLSDSKKGFDIIKRMAAQGVAVAQDVLGQMNEEGESVPQDLLQAAHWYRKAADRGNEDAQDHLAMLYEKGRGVPVDPVQAYVWFQQAAWQGDRRARGSLERLLKTLSKMQLQTAQKVINSGGSIEK